MEVSCGLKCRKCPASQGVLLPWCPTLTPEAQQEKIGGGKKVGGGRAVRAEPDWSSGDPRWATAQTLVPPEDCLQATLKPRAPLQIFSVDPEEGEIGCLVLEELGGGAVPSSAPAFPVGEGCVSVSGVGGDHPDRHGVKTTDREGKGQMWSMTLDSEADSLDHFLNP
ncbi:hypothetical protein NDU88_010164 [Pleurodeles waltl]|uniref:Uncharacterized protein n=1 Tax=Pleurodeles waltl TaxID=8319 RepID=A0AAV7QTL8_PLEWA|nr:hypothetical protein NDU88_010164 [Pleurodeles waltl]